MNHKQLHDALCKDFEALRQGKIKPQMAREVFNGAGKIIANCKNELVAISMGIAVDIPLFDIKKEEVPLKEVFKPIKKNQLLGQ